MKCQQIKKFNPSWFADAAALWPPGTWRSRPA